MIAKTQAAGGPTLDPKVLAFTSSLEADRSLLREDLIGSLAHVIMLAKQGIIPEAAAAAIHGGLVALWPQDAKAVSLREEEDVHMAVEAELAATIGEPAGLLHSARSRNDQVALDLRLHVREQCLSIREALAHFILELSARARTEKQTLLPSYTHRQRAQPISAAFWLAAHAQAFARDLESFAFVYEQADRMPLGSGAIAGTSLPIDRNLTRELLGFERITENAMDTVGDRDFLLDFTYAAARLGLHASRLATDVIDFASGEFGFLRLDDAIACGSSMMPQKKNPDLFELVRGKSAAQVGDLVSLLVTVKGLPGGYNRDLQEDRGPLLATGKRVLGVLEALRLALPRIQFVPENCLRALESDATQATDLAEALVQKGIPFRSAYQAVGRLVRLCMEQKLPLGKASLELARQADAAFDASVLERLNVASSVAHKISAGGTGSASVDAQLGKLDEVAAHTRAAIASLPRLDALFERLKARRLSP